jgi:hypothetical protein
MLTSLIAGLTFVAPLLFAPSRCEFHEANQLVHRWEGSCGRLFGQEPKMRLKRTTTVVSGRWQKGKDPADVWRGDMTDEGNPNFAIELEVYGGGGGVLRTEYGWYAVAKFSATPTSLTFQIDTSRAIAPNELDAEIVRRADALLASTAVWNRADNRQCLASAPKWSIYCAMEHASIEATCGFHHRRPALEMVREIVEERSVGRNYSHRLMDYNNDSTTSLDQVHGLFHDALARMNSSATRPLPPAEKCPAFSAPVATAADVMVIDRARQLLSSESMWDRRDSTQKCPDTQAALSILCAIRRASEQLTGEFDTQGVLVLEGRAVIDSVSTKRYQAHFREFNNDPSTTFADVQRFFRILRDRLAHQISMSAVRLPGRPSSPSSLRFSSQLSSQSDSRGRERSRR